jgi:hypothetical protein
MTLSGGKLRQLFAKPSKPSPYEGEGWERVRRAETSAGAL